MGFLGWLLGEEERDPGARLQRERGRQPLGNRNTAASPDSEGSPKKTPGPTGKNDEASFRSGLGRNPFKLSNKLELHVFSRAAMVLLEGPGDYCLFEYDGTSGHYHPADKLTFPHGDKTRGYYQEGDPIFVQELSIALADRNYPEAVKLLDMSEGFKMIANSLGMTITVGWVITKISGGPDPQSGTVYGTLAILVGEDLFCLVDGEYKFWGLRETSQSSLVRAASAGRSGQKLGPAFRHARQDTSGWKFVKTVAPIVAELAVVVLRGAAPTIRAIAFRTARAHLRRKLTTMLIVRAFVGAAQKMMKATLAFSKAAAVKYVELQLRPEQLKRRSDGSLVVGVRDTEQIVIAGTEAFVNTLMSEVAGDALKIPEAKDVQRKIVKAIADEVLAKFASAPQTLVSAHADAAQEYMTKYPDRELDVKSPHYQELLAAKLQDAFKNPLEVAVKSVCSSTGGFVKGVANEGT